eukprot:189255_1
MMTSNNDHYHTQYSTLNQNDIASVQSDYERPSNINNAPLPRKSSELTQWKHEIEMNTETKKMYNEQNKNDDIVIELNNGWAISEDHKIEQDVWFSDDLNDITKSKSQIVIENKDENNDENPINKHIRYHEEEKYFYDKEKTTEHVATKDFPKPQVDDYMVCGNDGKKCHAVQRIIHLLTYYRRSQSIQKESTLLYEYVISLKDYTVSIFYEDWYHIKKCHFNTDDDYEWFKSNEQINCDNNKSSLCVHMNRHHRERGREIYNTDTNIDVKNIILRDQIDSIHAFVFHSTSKRNHIHQTKSLWICDKCDFVNNGSNQDIKCSKCHHTTETNPTNTQKLLSRKEYLVISRKSNVPTENKSDDNNTEINLNTDIWGNNPKTLSDCTLSQIVFILNDENVFNKLDKLVTHKNEIINYVKSNELDGTKLFELNRKGFMNKISEHLNKKN